MKPRYPLLTAAASAIVVTATVGAMLPAATAADAVTVNGRALAGGGGGAATPTAAAPAPVAATSSAPSPAPAPPAAVAMAAKADASAGPDASTSPGTGADSTATAGDDTSALAAIAIPMLGRTDAADGWRTANRALALTLETRFDADMGAFAGGSGTAAPLPGGSASLPDAAATPPVPPIAPAGDGSAPFVAAADGDLGIASRPGGILAPRPDIGIDTGAFAVPTGVQVSAVPDSATWLMLIAGLGLIGLNLRRSHLPNVAS